MGRKRQKPRTPGLLQRGKYWAIDKKVFGRRIRETTGTSSYEEAEAILARRIEDTRQAVIFGVRPKRIFKEAAVKYIKENQHKDSIESDVSKLRVIGPYVNEMPLENIHMGSLQDFIQARRRDGVKTRTINHGLKIIRRILNLAAGEWIDENGLTWLLSAPKIKLLPEYDNREPEPLSWAQEASLMQCLPRHLQMMTLYAMNTGSREKEVCWLRWEWEIKIPELDTSIFILPHHITVNGKRIRLIKNGKDRLVVLNDIAKKAIDDGSSSRTRTCDPVINSHLLYQLSYRGNCTFFMALMRSVGPAA
jgi:site-specific recombinase XerD